VRALLDPRRAVGITHALLVASTACAAALAIGASAKLWLDASVQDSPRGGAKERAEPASESRRARSDYSAIFERNLFGSEPIVETGSGPAVRGELLLRGTAEFAGFGYAVIESAESGIQQLFAVGDLVFEGPKLVAVDARTATVLRGGRRVVLEITEAEVGSASAADGPAAAANSATGGGIRQVGDNRYVVDRGEVDHSIENLSSIVTQMRAGPYLKDGKSLGFRVFNIRAGSLFERMGLKNGDVIQSVNGTTLDDPTRALALLDEVETSDEITVDLLRDDHPNTLTYSIR
jgi:general secretion pathway protein C